MSSIFKKFPRTFWVANTIELVERFAWYGFFMLFANYLTQSPEFGALGFSQSEKGWLMGVGTGILYFLPVITGAIADAWGYKRVLILSFLIYVSAFLLLPMMTSFVGVFLMYLYLALGAALFKPIVSATVAKTTNSETASIGFGIFYMMVNFGAFLGPLCTMANNNGSYKTIFYISAGIISLNFLFVLFYNEPKRNKTSQNIIEVFKTTFRNIAEALTDVRFVIFLVLVSGFWAMYHQLFYTLPVFIHQWVDTSLVYDIFNGICPWITKTYGENGQMQSEFITNFDAMFIILFQIIISSLVMRLKAINSMIIGFLVCSIGMALTLLTQNVIFTIIAIFVFSVGEMMGSPKITEYISQIAPKDKVALYMGCSFIPVFLGNIGAGIISGNVYASVADKERMVRDLLLDKGLSISDGLTKNQVFVKACKELSMTKRELTNYLWETYHPYNIWIIILSIGLLATLGLIIYDRILLRKN